MRAFIVNTEPRSQAKLAAEIGVTQPAVSKTTSALDGLVVRSAAGWEAIDRVKLWDRFMAEYAGPGGVTTYWYGLESIIEQSKKVEDACASGEVPTLSSGDVAADALAAWRVPSRAIIYARSSIALDALGFAQTSRENATLQFTVPTDPTVWATAASWAHGRDATMVDPVIAAWDVANTGGPDAQDAVRRIRDRVLVGEASR